MAFVAVVVTRVRVCLPTMTTRFGGSRMAMLGVVFHRGLLRVVNAVMLAIFH